ncbi:DUF2536 family protein [Paenibacillus protaetiae]|uniref:DUF2536 family protein n=1 Tax=Paenibacillus protaetiae TaxID=2509456 RepID=A0A4P6F1M8_9BACL|nr:DUF2536 family protein [Paenibacillus protaetiae]QAY68029.1 DUF2536 family protein [Paenibacillus protaetiae]
MNFQLDLFENKVELFEAYDLKSLEKQIETQITNNQALLLDVSSIQYQVTFHPNIGKMLYSAAVHFKLKK